MGDDRRQDEPSLGHEAPPDHEGAIARPWAFNAGRRGWSEANARVVIWMAKHEEKRFALCFQCLQGVLHQQPPDAASLTIGPNCQRGEHGGAQAIAVWLLQPHA